MPMKLTMLAVAYLVVGGFLLAVSYQPSGPVTTQKTDRVAGSTFLVERFAG
jgi:quinol-cytochrome oxidoreductase complex cytochrome b subunit